MGQSCRSFGVYSRGVGFDAVGMAEVTLGMSASPPKADIIDITQKSLLLTLSGH